MIVSYESGVSAAHAYREADGLILATPDGNLAFEPDRLSEHRVMELTMAIRWAYRHELLVMSSFNANQ